MCWHKVAEEHVLHISIRTDVSFSFSYLSCEKKRNRCSLNVVLGGYDGSIHRRLRLYLVTDGPPQMVFGDGGSTGEYDRISGADPGGEGGPGPPT